MDSKELRERTNAFSLGVVRLFQKMPRDIPSAVLGKQLLRCATSVGANYRAASLAKSRSDFVAKIKICEEEADESEYWLDLLVDSGAVSENDVSHLRNEARELTRIFSASAKTARKAL